MPDQNSDPIEASILMVDDHVPNLVALEAMLAPVGAQLVQATSGEAALRHIAEREFALVLMDHRMPGLNGAETVQAMHTRFPERQPPVILLTAYALDDIQVRRAYELGVVDILQKPYLMEVLRTKVSVFVELFRSNELLRWKLREEQRQERERFEQELVGMVSHDLRNPLSAIVLGASRLLDTAGPEDVTTRRLALRIKSAADRATRLVHDLLDFTQARLGNHIPVNPQRGDLHRVVEDTMEDLRIEHGSARVTLRTEGPAEGDFDADRLSQVLVNLVSNAVRYGARDEPVEVRCRGSEVELILEVSNRGSPIRPEERQRLFEPLRRGDDSHRLARGLGLGLFIVEQIVRAHQGQVEVESDELRGTTFRVVIPRRTRG